jgi:glycosyltransferase involved in cell wall biosynthesis
MTEPSPDISIIVPIKDEAENIELLAGEIADALAPRDWSWETVWIDDGSTDGSLALLENLHAVDPRHRYLSFAENRGQSAALCAGFKACRGKVLATIDGDGQNDPTDLPDLLELVLTDESDMVNGYRARRRDSLVRKISSKVGNGFRTWLTGKTVRDVGCSTRAFRRECIEDLPRFNGMHRFLPTLIGMRGFRMTEVPVNHRPRRFGQSKYNISNRLWVGLGDTLGVMWLKKRAFSYTIQSKSG